MFFFGGALCIVQDRDIDEGLFSETEAQPMNLS